MLIGVTILTPDGATMCASGLQVSLLDDELADLEQTGSVRREYGNTVLAARDAGGFIVLMLWERRRHPCTISQQFGSPLTLFPEFDSSSEDWPEGISGLPVW